MFTYGNRNPEIHMLPINLCNQAYQTVYSIWEVLCVFFYTYEDSTVLKNIRSNEYETSVDMISSSMTLVWTQLYGYK